MRPSRSDVLIQGDAHKALFYNAFLNDPQLQSLMQALGGAADQVRVVGGAVRNALREVPVNDLDIACVHVPGEVVKRAEDAGFKTIPTGIDHGTVTVVAGKASFEVTTLREDIETNGRHALVRFGTDWQRDAERRDFTMNALSVDREGTLFDPVAGLDDCLRGHVRFIGKAQKRIEEDALRILRFFRFSAHFGDGALDMDGLKASNDALPLLTHLSAERVQHELKKLMAAPRAGQLFKTLSDAVPVLAQLGIVVNRTNIAPMQHCARCDWAMRLSLLMIAQPQALLQTVLSLRFSNADIKRLDTLMKAIEFLQANDAKSAANIRLAAYKYGAEIADDTAYILSRVSPDHDADYHAFVAPLQTWQVPTFPLKGADLLSAGFSPGPEIGKLLSSLEAIWIEARFSLSHGELMEEARKSQK